MDSSPEKTSKDLVELKAILQSILTGRVAPMRVEMLALRYRDIKGCRFPHEDFACSSLAEVIQKFLFGEFYCTYMRYYRDHVVCLKERDLARQTVIERLRHYMKIRGRAKPITDVPVKKKLPLKRYSSLREDVETAAGIPSTVTPTKSFRNRKRKLSPGKTPEVCRFRSDEATPQMKPTRFPTELFELLNIQETMET